MTDLTAQKRLAADGLDGGEGRVWFDPEAQSEIAEAITRHAGRDLGEQSGIRDEDATTNPGGRELTATEWPGGCGNTGAAAPAIRGLVDTAEMEGFDEVYSLTGEHDYLSQFGFRPVETEDLPEPLRDRLESKRAGSDPDAIPMVIDAERFRMPEEYRERFKRAAEATEESAEPEESAEDFGIDPDEATYKYDTG